MSGTKSLILVFLLAGALAGFADSSFDFSVSADDLALPTAEIAACLDLGDERLLGDAGALYWDAGAAGSFVPADKSVGISAKARLEASLAKGAWVVIGYLSGIASATSSSGPGPLAGTIGTSLVLEGETVGCSIEPWATIQGIGDPYIEAGLAVRVPVLAGSAVVEPGIAASARRGSDGAWVLELAPGIDLSWYPAVPLATEISGRWTGTMDAGGSWTSAWGCTLSLSGVLGECLTFVATGSAMVEPSAITGDASSEITINLGDVAGGQLSLPLRLAVSFGGTDGFTAGAGAGLRFSW